MDLDVYMSRYVAKAMYLEKAKTNNNLEQREYILTSTLTDQTRYRSIVVMLRIHHDLEFLEAEHSVSVEIEPADHGLALVDLLVRAELAQHPLQAQRRDAPLALHLVHPERLLQSPAPLLLRRRFQLHQLQELLLAQQPVAVGVRGRHEFVGVLGGHVLAERGLHAEPQLGCRDLAVVVAVER